MRIVLQRVLNANVIVDEKVVGAIGKGLMVLVGFTEGDDNDVINHLVKKLINIRVFDDDNGIMNLNILDAGGSILSISQFTLYGDATKGNRPSYSSAMKSDEAVVLYKTFNDELNKYINVETGVFGADMKVSLVNDGPITLILEKEKKVC